MIFYQKFKTSAVQPMLEDNACYGRFFSYIVIVANFLCR